MVDPSLKYFNKLKKLQIMLINFTDDLISLKLYQVSKELQIVNGKITFLLNVIFKLRDVNNAALEFKFRTEDGKIGCRVHSLHGIDEIHENFAFFHVVMVNELEELKCCINEEKANYLFKNIYEIEKCLNEIKQL